MTAQGERRTAATAAVVAGVLWLVTTEVRGLFTWFGVERAWLAFWPQGSPLPLQFVLRGRSALLGIVTVLVGLAVLFLVVYLVTRAAVRGGPPTRGAVVLSAWMAAVLGGFVAALVSTPLALLTQGFPTDFWWQQLTFVTAAPYWGVAVGWIAALAAAATVRPGQGAAPSYPGAGAQPGNPGYSGQREASNLNRPDDQGGSPYL